MANGTATGSERQQAYRGEGHILFLHGIMSGDSHMIMLCHVEQWSIRISQVKYNPIAILCYRYIFGGEGVGLRSHVGLCICGLAHGTSFWVGFFMSLS